MGTDAAEAVAAVHRSAKVKRWLAANCTKITLFFLPGYSAGLNPNEFLNPDVKSNALSLSESTGAVHV